MSVGALNLLEATTSAPQHQQQQQQQEEEEEEEEEEHTQRSASKRTSLASKAGQHSAIHAFHQCRRTVAAIRTLPASSTRCAATRCAAPGSPPSISTTAAP